MTVLLARKPGRLRRLETKPPLEGSMARVDREGGPRPYVEKASLPESRKIFPEYKKAIREDEISLPESKKPWRASWSSGLLWERRPSRWEAPRTQKHRD
jgi:hypothetical protein